MCTAVAPILQVGVGRVGYMEGRVGGVLSDVPFLCDNAWPVEVVDLTSVGGTRL